MSLIGHIEKLGTELNLVSVLNQLEEIKSTFKERTFLDVLVLGQFKAGKSSFINSLLQNNFLPTGVVPVTAIVTRVCYGEEQKAVVSHFDGSRQTISLDELSLFISEKNNPENIKEVSVVDVFLPSMKSFHPVRFVDTPGLGSVFAHNSQVTQSWYGKIKVAIVVISAAQPLSENDLSLIQNAIDQSPAVSIILSKADLISKSELIEMSTFIEAKLQEKFNLKLALYPYSINGSETNYRHSLIKTVVLPLSKDADAIQQDVYQHKLNFLAKKTLGYLQINLQMKRQNDEDRKVLLDRIIDETLNLKYIKKDLVQIGNSYKESTRNILQSIILEQHSKLLVKNLSDDLISRFDSWRGNLSKVTEQYENWVRQTMVRAIKEVELKEWNNVEEHPNEAYNHFNRFLTNFRERLNQNIKKTLKIEMPVGEIEIKASPLQSPHIHISRTFDSHIDMLWFLVPMPIFRKTVRDHFLKEIPFEVEKNCYRLIAQLTNNINGVIDEMQQRAINYVTHELESLTTALRQHQWDETEINSKINDLKKELSLNN